jgi:hypothetical protein
MTDRQSNDVAVIVRMPYELRVELAHAARAAERTTASLLRFLAREYLADAKRQQR